ncbi:MAG TPA: MGMT family protein [Anaerolineae bacterium]|nr:MGMT family protein [Anaerolineae bacterium]
MTTLPFPEQVYVVVQRIPEGKVATYGQIARILGRPRGAREVGWALRDLPDNRDVPWQRVINAQGRVSFPPGSQGATVQQAMLEAEGVVFRPDGSVDLKRFGWEGLDLGEQHELRSGETPGEADGPQLSLGI